MEEKFAIGDFGCAKFIAKTGWKAETVCYGTITAMDRGCVEFKDNDDNIYLIRKSKFQFTKEEFKIQIEK